MKRLSQPRPGVCRLAAISGIVASLALFSPPSLAADPHEAEGGISPLSWSPLPPLPDPYGLGGPLVGITGGQLVVAGGANFPVAPGEDLWSATKIWHSAVYRYPIGAIDDGDRGEWSPLPPMEAPLGYSAVVSTRHGIACLGGERAEGPVAEAFLLRWNEESGRLLRIPLPDLPGPMAFGSAAAIGDAIYLAGGLERSSLDSALRNFWRLDLSPLDRDEAPQWEELPPWPGPARGFNLTVAQRCAGELRIYVVSGRRQRPGTEGLAGLEVLPDVYEFHPSTGTWRERAPMPRPLNAGTGGALGERHLVVLSGDDGTLVTQIETLKDGHPGFPREAWAYNTEADAWSRAGETPANQATTPAVAHEDSLILVSGELRPRVRAREAWRIRLPPALE